MSAALLLLNRTRHQYDGWFSMTFYMLTGIGFYNKTSAQHDRGPGNAPTCLPVWIERKAITSLATCAQDCLRQAINPKRLGVTLLFQLRGTTSETLWTMLTGSGWMQRHLQMTWIMLTWLGWKERSSTWLDWCRFGSISWQAAQKVMSCKLHWPFNMDHSHLFGLKGKTSKMTRMMGTAIQIGTMNATTWLLHACAPYSRRISRPKCPRA